MYKIGVLIVLCIVLMYFGVAASIDRKDFSFVDKYRWTVVIPYILLLIAVYSVISLLNIATPEGLANTKPVEVRDVQTKYNYLLRLKIENDPVEGGYTIKGFFDPDTGKYKEVDSDYQYSSFGDPVKFTYKGGKSVIECRAAVDCADLDLVLTDRIKYASKGSLIFFAVVLLYSVYGIRTTFFYFKRLKIND